MGSSRRFRLPVHRSRLPSLCNSHGEQHPVRELSRSHRPLQDLHRRSYRIRNRLLPAVQRRPTTTNNPDPSSRRYIDRRWCHLLGSNSRRRSGRIRKTSKVAVVYENSTPSFFLTLLSKLSRVGAAGFFIMSESS